MTDFNKSISDLREEHELEKINFSGTSKQDLNCLRYWFEQTYTHDETPIPKRDAEIYLSIVEEIGSTSTVHLKRIDYWLGSP
jgi:hypothetical protein